MYLKNCIVALTSIRLNNKEENTDVALVTNIECPEPYCTMLCKNNIKIIYAAFDSFFFGNKYKWSLAFYKLCAFDYVVDHFNYDYYAYLDADVYCQRDFTNIWKECNEAILLYDISHGLSDQNYNLMLEDYAALRAERKLITHYGGEFCASNREKAQLLIQKEKVIFEQMSQLSLKTSAGDEFILSVAAYDLKYNIKNASPYISRFWTGTYRIVTTAYVYEDLVILHCPAEKNAGLLNIYKKYIKKNKMPSREKAIRLLHIDRRSIRCQFQMLRAYMKSGKMPIR